MASRGIQALFYLSIHCAMVAANGESGNVNVKHTIYTVVLLKLHDLFVLNETKGQRSVMCHNWFPTYRHLRTDSDAGFDIELPWSLSGEVLGYIGCVVAAVFYGSQFIPLKKVETGDGKIMLRI